MTIIERAQGLTQELNRLTNSQVSQTEADGFRTRDEELSTTADEVMIPARYIELFRAKGINCHIPVQRVNRLKATIDEMAAKYQANPRSILDPDTNWRFQTKTGIERIGREIREELLLRWHDYVEGLRPEIDQGLMIVLQNSPTFSSHTSRIRELNAILDDLSRQLPRNQQEVNQPEQFANELNNTVENLPGDIPEPVRDLFIAIHRGDATVKHLSEGALLWLRERNMLDSIAVSWKGDADRGAFKRTR